jgi:hypothetical protein
MRIDARLHVAGLMHILLVNTQIGLSVSPLHVDALGEEYFFEEKCICYLILDLVYFSSIYMLDLIHLALKIFHAKANRSLV